MIEALPRAIFTDRVDAGRHLAAAMTAKGGQPLVLGLARGGVIVAAEVARTLGLELDVLVARKLGAPQSEELAIGAVTAGGGLYLNTDLIRALEVGPAYLQAEIDRQRRVAAQREAMYRLDRPASSLSGRSVMLVDDGLATGATTVAAARSVRSQGASFVQIAVPVGSPGSCGDLRDEADDVVCLHQPNPFWSVGYFYEDFAQTTDEEVLAALSQERAA
jgi:putative phosphoribosyl transferase